MIVLILRDLNVLPPCSLLIVSLSLSTGGCPGQSDTVQSKAHHSQSGLAFLTSHLKASLQLHLFFT
jgi:hypothetical protein